MIAHITRFALKFGFLRQSGFSFGGFFPPSAFQFSLYRRSNFASCFPVVQFCFAGGIWPFGFDFSFIYFGFFCCPVGPADLCSPAHFDIRKMQT